MERSLHSVVKLEGKAGEMELTVAIDGSNISFNYGGSDFSLAIQHVDFERIINEYSAYHRATNLFNNAECEGAAAKRVREAGER